MYSSPRQPKSPRPAERTGDVAARKPSALADIDHKGVFVSVAIVPFPNAHLDEASSLVAQGFLGLRRRVGPLPGMYEDSATIRPMLTRLCESSGGVAAVERGELRGFMLGTHLENWRGQRTAYVPEWAHGGARGDLEHLYERMYAAIAADWVSAGYTSHLVTVPGDADDAMHALRWMGFGMCGLDSVMDLDRRDFRVPPGRLKGVRARRAGPADLETVVRLEGALRRYLSEPPILLPYHDSPAPYLAEWLQGRTGSVWLAERAGVAVGLMGVGPGGNDRCQWLQDDGTAGIRPAYIGPAERNAGLGSLLLLRCIGWARAAGYERLAVDFETDNILGRRFWSGHFHPVCVSLLRNVVGSRSAA
jgi:GNAT superfamily N-acetyltransferase